MAIGHSGATTIKVQTIKEIEYGISNAAELYKACLQKKLNG